jgi:DnaD/phage-associated family protein
VKPQGFEFTNTIMEFKINLVGWNSVFAVPRAIVDEYIKLASGDNLKVLLYCLRYGGQSLSDGEIARATNVGVESVNSSLEFWKQRGLFSEQTASADIPLSVKKVEAERDPEFAPKEISSIAKDDETVKYIFEKVQLQKGKITHTEQKTIVQIIEYHNMKPDVLLMLVEYCFGANKFSPKYIKTVALDWLNNGINTHESASLKIKELEELENARHGPQKTKTEKTGKKSSFDLDELEKQIMEEYKKNRK